AALRGRFLVDRGRELARRFRDSGEQRGLVNGEVFGLLAEVGLGGGLKAVGDCAEEDVVDVQLHDLLLRVVAFDLERDEPLVELARVGLLGGEEQTLGYLLRQCRAALAAARRNVLPRRARDAYRVNTVVLEEARVLDG